jgi:hypothetical protein
VAGNSEVATVREEPPVFLEYVIGILPTSRIELALHGQEAETVVSGGHMWSAETAPSRHKAHNAVTIERNERSRWAKPVLMKWGADQRQLLALRPRSCPQPESTVAFQEAIAAALADALLTEVGT